MYCRLTQMYFVCATVALLLFPTAASATESASFVEELDRSLPAHMQRYNVPGVSVALIEDGQIVLLKSYGLADKAANVPMTPDTIHQVASISKSLTAWGVMKLVDEGLFDLDEPVGTYLTRWHIPPSPFDDSGVTIRRLLDHTAGISLSGYGAGTPVGEPLPRLEASLSGETRGCGAVELIRQPGEAFMYSGGGYTILQLVVEEVTGQSFATYMSQSVLKPLGMESSTFTWSPAIQGRLSSAYGTYYNQIENQRYVEDAAGGLYSTPSDLAHFTQAVVNDPGLLSEQSYDLLFEGESYGLGHGMLDLPTGQRFVFGGGTRMGWQSDFVVDPADRSGFVVLSNANGGIILNLILISRWAEWKTGSPWPSAELYLLQYPFLMVLAGVLGFVCAVRAGLLARQFRQGQRLLLFRTAKQRKVIRLLVSCLILLAIVLWWLGSFTDTFDPRQTILWLPEPFLLVSILFTWLMLLLVAATLFPKRKAEL